MKFTNIFIKIFSNKKRKKMIKAMVLLKQKNSYYPLIALDFKNVKAIIDTVNGQREISFDEIRQVFLVTKKTVTISSE